MKQASWSQAPAPSRVCRHCRKSATEHCEGCAVCPDQECPYWCPLNDDPYN